MSVNVDAQQKAQEKKKKKKKMRSGDRDPETAAL